MKGCRKSGRPSPVAWSRATWLSLIGVVVCTAAVGIRFSRSFWRTDEASQQKAGSAVVLHSTPSNSSAPAVSAPNPIGSKVQPEVPTFEPAFPRVELEGPPVEPEALPPKPSSLSPKSTDILPERPTAPVDSASTPQTAIEAYRQEALEVAGRLLEEFPNRSDSLVLMGTVHHGLGQTDEALRYWEECLRLDPKRADVYKSMGWIALQKGESEKALTLWRKALAIKSEMPKIHEFMARALMNLGRPKEAIAHLEKEVRYSPRSNSIYYLLGEAHLRLKEYEQAKTAYRAAIEIEPGFKSSYYGLAAACARLGQKEDARKYREAFKELKDKELKEVIVGNVEFDDVAAARSNLVRVLIDAGRIYHTYGNLPNSQQYWQRAAALDPKNLECRIQLAALYQQSGRYPEALQISNQLVQIDPQNVAHRFNVGVLNGRLKRFDAAEQALRGVVQLVPRESRGYGELARVLLRANRKLPEARTLASTAVRLGPTAPHYFLLSEACGKNGDLQGSLVAIERAIELDPGNAKYKQVRDFIKSRN